MDNADIDKVEARLRVAGKECDFLSLNLRQKFNAHHVLWVELRSADLGKKWMDSPQDLINLIGEYR